MLNTLVAQMVKNLPAVQLAWVQFLGQEAWWARESMGSQGVGYD